MDNQNIKLNNFIDETKENKKNLRRSSIKRQNIGKSLKRLSFSNKIYQDESITKIPAFQKIPLLKSNMKSKNILTKKFTIFIIIINFILPGIGTMFSCLLIDDEKIRRGFYALGFCSLITSPLIIGYLLSLLSSYFFYKCYLSNKSIERFLYSINKIQQEWTNIFIYNLYIIIINLYLTKYIEKRIYKYCKIFLLYIVKWIKKEKSINLKLINSNKNYSRNEINNI